MRVIFKALSTLYLTGCFLFLASIQPYAAQAPMSLQEIANSPMRIVSRQEIKAYLATHMRQAGTPERTKLNKIIRKYAVKYGLNPGLILSVIKVESNYNRFAISPVGALGYMQLMPETAEWISPQAGLDWQSTSSLFDAETNIHLGCYYLSYLIKKFGGDLSRALVAYNEGPSKVDRKISGGRALTLTYYNQVRFHLNEIAFRR